MRKRTEVGERGTWKPWELTVLRYLDYTFGSALIVCRPDEVDSTVKNVDLLVRTKKGLVAVEHTQFSFDARVMDQRKVEGAKACLLPKPKGLEVAVFRRMILDKKLAKQSACQELTRRIAAKARELVVVTSQQERRRHIAEVNAEWAKSGADTQPDYRFSRSFKWCGYKIVVRRLPADESSRLCVFSFDDPAQMKREVKRVMTAKLPKLLQAAKRLRAVPLLVVEAAPEQIDFSADGPFVEALAASLGAEDLPAGFHCVTLAARVADLMPVCVIWDDEGNTLQPYDDGRMYGFQDRLNNRNRETGQ